MGDTLRAVVRPGGGLSRAMGILHGQNGPAHLPLSRILEDTDAVEGLARVLTQGIESVMTKDGRLDTKDLAAYVLAELQRNQR
jgi:hypothetical protein